MESFSPTHASACSMSKPIESTDFVQVKCTLMSSLRIPGSAAEWPASFFHVFWEGRGFGVSMVMLQDRVCVRVSCPCIHIYVYTRIHTYTYMLTLHDDQVGLGPGAPQVESRAGGAHGVVPFFKMVIGEEIVFIVVCCCMFTCGVT